MTFPGLVEILAQNPNYTLVVMFITADGTVVRYTLVDSGIDLPVVSVPYTGQMIPKNFRLEVWNTQDGNVVQVDPITLVSSVLGQVDYRYGTDFQLAGNLGAVTNFQSAYVKSTTPPLTYLDAWWNYTDVIPPKGAIAIGWPSRVNPADILTVSSGVFAQHPSDTYIEFINNKIIGCNNLNGGTGYYPAEIWIIACKNASAGYSNGNVVNVTNNTADISSINANQTDFQIGGGAIPLLKVPDTGGSLVFYAIRVSQDNAYSYALDDDTVLYTTNGIANLSISNTITVGGTSAFFLKEIMLFSQVLSVADQQAVSKYIADTYASGMMPLPLVFPDLKPVNT